MDQVLKKPSRRPAKRVKKNEGVPILEAVAQHEPQLSSDKLRKFDKDRKPTEWFQLASPLAQPEWADHLVSCAAVAGITASVVLNVWGDCAGMGSEVFACKKIAAAIARANPDFQLEIHASGACDKNANSLYFLEKNHDPKILSRNMTDRTIIDGKVWDQDLKTGAAAQIPDGLDVYVLGFPCTPWSLRGAGAGYDDPNAKPLFVGLATIAEVKPKVFVLECVCRSWRQTPPSHHNQPTNHR